MSKEKQILNPAWLPIDSRYGRYLFGGTPGVDTDGFAQPKAAMAIALMTYATFKSERFFVKKDCASEFLIRALFIGNYNMGLPLPIDQGLIAEPFAVDFDDLSKISLEDLAKEAIIVAAKTDGPPVVRPIEVRIDRLASKLLGQPFELPTIRPGICLTMNVENIGTRPMRFLGAMSGTASWD